jgi:hypothetical protein
MPNHLEHAPWFFPTLAVVHALVLAIWAWLLVDLAHRRPEHRAAIAVGCVAAVAWAAIGPGPLYQHLPRAWFTPLQEGDALRSWQMLQVQGLHMGPGYLGFWHKLFVAPRAGPHTIFALHAWFGVLDLLLLTATVWVTTGSRYLALLWLLIGALARPWLDAACSEQAATLCAAYFFPALLSAWALGDPSRAAVARALAAFSLLLTALCLATLRVELAGLPLIGLAAGLPRVWGWRDRLLSTPGWVLLPLLTAWALLATTAASRELVVQPVIPGVAPLGWALIAAHPLNASWLVALMFALASTPPLLTWLSAWGARRALREGRAPLLGLLGLILLANASHSAAHGGLLGGPHAVAPYELYRYLLSLYLPWLLLAAWGWRDAQGLIERALPGRGALALTLCLLVPPVPALWSHLPNAARVWGPIGPMPVLPLSPLERIDRDPQRALTFARAHDDPDCAHAMRFLPWFGPPGRPSRWGLLRRDGRTGQAMLQVADDDGTPPGDLLRRAWPDARCAVLHWSLDCALLPPEVCEADVAGLTLLDEQRWSHLPFIHPQHERLYRPELRVATYALPW